MSRFAWLAGVLLAAGAVTPVADGRILRADADTKIVATRARAPVPLAVGDMVFSEDEISVTGGSVTVLVKNGAVWTLRGGQTRKLKDSLAWTAKVQKSDVLFALPNGSVSISAGRLAGIDPGARLKESEEVNPRNGVSPRSGGVIDATSSLSGTTSATEQPKGPERSLQRSRFSSVVTTAPPPRAKTEKDLRRQKERKEPADSLGALNALPLTACGTGRAHMTLRLMDGAVDEVSLAPGEGASEAMLRCLGDALRDLKLPGTTGTIDADLAL